MNRNDTLLFVVFEIPFARKHANLVALVSDWKRLSIRDIKIVAEYVENKDIQNKLEKYDIDFSQGYYFSVPSPELGNLP